MTRSILHLAAFLFLAPFSLAAETGPPQPIDTSKDGTFRSGAWEYQVTISGEGTKSEGRHGKLLLNGQEVTAPDAVNDYHETPWGKLYWVGQPVVAFGGHGWMPKPLPSKPVVKALAAPGAAAVDDGPVVMLMVLGDGNAALDQRKLEDWVTEEMKKRKVERPGIVRDWFRLTHETLTLHDSKMYGRMHVRLALPRSEETLTLQIDGNDPARIELPRKDGAVTFAHRELGSPLVEDVLGIYMAFRVEKAAPGAGKPLDIGPDADGKTVVLGGAKRVSINLPANENTGLVWRVKSIEGDAVQAQGEAQFSLDLPVAPTKRQGVFEQLFRVTGKGKTTVTMEHLRTWQTDKPAEKTFRVTLE